MLACLIEVVDYGNRNFIAAHTKKGTRIPRPVEVRRPYSTAETRSPNRDSNGADSGPKKKASVADMKAFFADTKGR